MGSWFMKYELIDSINNIDDFYKTTLTQYNDIRDLSKNLYYLLLMLGRIIVMLLDRL